jgi:hypothetical protein
MRLTPEREKDIRVAVATGIGYSIWDIRDTLNEIDALRYELNKTKEETQLSERLRKVTLDVN